jgi:hypothetical protein
MLHKPNTQPNKNGHITDTSKMKSKYQPNSSLKLSTELAKK